MLGQHVCGGYHHRSHLVQSDRDIPELVVVLQYDEDHISFLHTILGEVIGGLIGESLDVPEGEHLLVSLIIAPLKGPSVRVVHRYIIDDIVPEVEIIWIVYAVCLQQSIRIVGLINVSQVDVSRHLLEPSFITTARNVHPSLLVAIIPCGFPES